MGALSIWHILAVAVVAALLLGGGGRLSGLMGELGSGLRSLREGLKDDPPAGGGPNSGQD
jgi:sec-independent protein translocase protein TatA